MFHKLVEELARETQAKCGLVLFGCVKPETLKEMNDAPAQEMTAFCEQFEESVASRILEIGKEQGVKARAKLNETRKARGDKVH